MHKEFKDFHLKLADVTPCYLKKSKISKDCYRSIIILPNVSEIHERYIYNQMQQYSGNILPKYQGGICIGYNSQQCLNAMGEKRRESVDKGDAFGALFTDLSKALHCLPHELLIANLHVYGYDMKSLTVIHD